MTVLHAGAQEASPALLSKESRSSLAFLSAPCTKDQVTSLAPDRIQGNFQFFAAGTRSRPGLASRLACRPLGVSSSCTIDHAKLVALHSRRAPLPA